jgi:hypothetical protein
MALEAYLLTAPSPQNNTHGLHRRVLIDGCCVVLTIRKYSKKYKKVYNDM